MATLVSYLAFHRAVSPGRDPAGQPPQGPPRAPVLRTARRNHSAGANGLQSRWKRLHLQRIPEIIGSRKWRGGEARARAVAWRGWARVTDRLLVARF
jgi:hypothetical protein